PTIGSRPAVEARNSYGAARVGGWIGRMSDGGPRQPRLSGRRPTGRDHSGEVTAQDIDWLVAYLRTVVTASRAVWAGRGITLLQLTALHLISALAPVTLTDLARAL